MQKVTVGAVLVLHACLLLHSLRQNYVVVDEVGHLPAGLSHWDTGTYGAYRVNPPLWRILAVLPVLAARPERDYRHLSLNDRPGERSEWFLGTAFAASNEVRYFDLVCLARLAGVCWSLAAALVIYRWARDLYGKRSALVAMVIWCIGPNTLTHAQLLTPDMPAAAAGVIATYCFWRYVKKPSFGIACLCGVLLGVAQLTKYTMLVLYLLWPLMAVLAWWKHRTDPPVGIPRRKTLLQLLLMFCISILVINAGYEFSGTGRPLGEYSFVSRALGGEPANGRSDFRNGRSGNRFAGTWAGSYPIPLPADYVLGIDVQKRDFEAGLASYLSGKWQHQGWWYYYLYALAVKVPIGLLILVMWSTLLTLGGHTCSANWREESILAFSALSILVLVSAQTGFNHHLRYVLPMFPFVVISASKVGFFLAYKRWKSGIVVLLLLAWFTTSSLCIHPHYLSYFNEAAGGPDKGHDHLVDSNIDWGQDLLFLKKWLQENPEAQPLGLAYFNVIDPRLVGINYSLPPCGPTEVSSTRNHNGFLIDGPRPGYHAISVNYLRGFSGFPPPDGAGGYANLPPNAFVYFHHFRPIAKAGYSIFIYHVTLQDANRVRALYGLPLLTEPHEPPP
jgi:hypothetical protein